MKEFLKKVGCSIPIIIYVCMLVFSMVTMVSSCSKPKVSEVDDSYHEGIERGMKDVFIDMWMASTEIATLNLGDKWETDHFIVKLNKIYDRSVWSEENVPYVEFDLILNGMTIEECVRRDEMFFNIYSVYEGNWNMVLGYDDYYDFTALNQLEGSHGVGKVRLYDDAQFLVAIIIIDSHIYTARYTIT